MLARMRSLGRMMFRRSDWESELNEEIRFHIEQRAEHLAQGGMPRALALRQARLEFGGVEAYRERCREVRGARWFDELRRNLMYAARSMRRNPGFTAVAVLSLALGIGANVAMFGFVQRLILSPLPVRDPAGLHMVVLDTVRGIHYNLSYPKFEKLRDNFPLFDALFGWGIWGEHNISAGDRRELTHITAVTGTYFEGLGVRPAMGRLITAEDDHFGGGANVAVLSDHLWKDLFGGDPRVLARGVKIDDIPYQIIGVVPPEFTGTEPGNPFDIYIPVHAGEPGVQQMLKGEGNMWMRVMARLKPDVPFATAQAALREGWPRFSEARQISLGDHSRPEFLTMEDGSHGYSTVRIEFSRPVLVLMALVAVVLLIACANLATLLFVRGASRAGEMAIRTALGAARGQLIRQWLTESALLAGAGGLAGLLAAGWIDRLLLYFVEEPSRNYLRLHTNAGILLFTAGAMVAACLLFGVWPALRASSVGAEPALRAHSQSMLGRRGRASHVALAGQLAASLVLMVGSLLFARTLGNLNNRSGGFDRKTVVYATPFFWRVGYPRDRIGGAMKQIVERLRNSPDFVSVSMGNPPLLYGGPGGWGWIVVPGYTYAPFENNVAYISRVAPHYFDAVSIPLLAGRDFDDRDQVDPPRTAIVNERFAKHYFRGQNPLGQKFSFGDQPPTEIIAVVKDANVSSMREPPPDLVYYPPVGNWAGVLVARIQQGRNATQCESEIRTIIDAVIGKHIPVETGRLEQTVQDSLRRDRLVADLSAAFGLLGVLLASIGLYGAIAHSVTGRTREIGIRMALGAERRDVMRMVFRQSLSITVLGVAVGMPLAIVGAKLVQPMLFGVSPADPVSLAGSAAVLAAVALCAGLWPALRAARLDPTRALRYE